MQNHSNDTQSELFGSYFWIFSPTIDTFMVIIIIQEWYVVKISFTDFCVLIAKMCKLRQHNVWNTSNKKTVWHWCTATAQVYIHHHGLVCNAILGLKWFLCVIKIISTIIMQWNMSIHTVHILLNKTWNIYILIHVYK